MTGAPASDQWRLREAERQVFHQWHTHAIDERIAPEIVALIAVAFSRAAVCWNRRNTLSSSSKYQDEREEARRHWARRDGARCKTCEDGRLVAADMLPVEGQRGGGAWNPLHAGTNIQICTITDLLVKTRNIQ